MGSAILISVLTNVTNSQKPAHSLLKSSPLQYKSQMIDVTLNGYHAAFWIAIAFAVIGLLATSRLGNGNKIHAKYDSNAKKGGNA